MSFGSLVVGDVRQRLSCCVGVLCLLCASGVSCFVSLVGVCSSLVLLVLFVVLFCCWSSVVDCVMLFGISLLLAAVV